MKKLFFKVIISFLFILVVSCENAEISKLGGSVQRSDSMVVDQISATLFIKNLAANLANTTFFLDTCEMAQCGNPTNIAQLKADINNTIESNGIPLSLKDKIAYRIVGKVVDTASGVTKFYGELNNYTIDVNNPIIELIMKEVQNAIDANSFKNIFPVIRSVTFVDNTANGIYSRTGTVNAYDPNGKALTYNYKLKESAGNLVEAVAPTNIANQTFKLSIAGSYIYEVTVTNGSQSVLVAYPFSIEAIKAIFNLVPTLSILNPAQNATYAPGTNVTFSFKLWDDTKDLCLDNTIGKILDMYDPLTNDVSQIKLDNACNYVTKTPDFISTYTYNFVYYDVYGSYGSTKVTISVK